MNSVADLTYCNQCGHGNPLGANFCSSCGAALEQRDDATTLSFQPEVAETDDHGIDLSAIPPGAAALVVTRGKNQGSRYVLHNDVTRAGRHPDSDVFLDDVTVSRRHVEIERDGTEFRVRDAGSLNGTYLNRNRVDDAPINDGDVVQIGSFKLVFVRGEG